MAANATALGTICACATFLFAVEAGAAGPEGALGSRGWEMVSPAEKNGGDVEGPGAPGGGVFQAAAPGGAIAFASRTSFGTAAGAAPVSQYLAQRSSTGWSTTNLTPPQLSGTYAGGAYLLFSGDLSRALLANGWRCRDGSAVCPAENPPLGSGAPIGYRNLYLRDNLTGLHRPLLTTSNSPALSLAPEDFHLALAGATSDLGHAVLSTCAALTADAVEVADPEGCDAAGQNLYLWSDGALEAVNLLPGQTQTAPGASLASATEAVFGEGSRVYWRDAASGTLYLREGGTTVQVDTIAGGGGSFQAASGDGSIAFFTRDGHLYRFEAATGEAADLTPGGGVEGVLGASADGARVYYVSASGLVLLQEGAASVKVSADASGSNVTPSTARVAPDGGRLAFVSTASLTGYSNVGKTEVFVYDVKAKKLTCVSCSPFGKTPLGPSSLPAPRAAGGGPAAYEPRALSVDGARLFFDSADRLVLSDTNKAPDVYQWQASGAGGCAKAEGCIGLVSSGRVGSASFLDADADGADAFFLTATSLLPSDPEAVDVYDARAGGGFAEPPSVPACEGDDCQGPPPTPDDPRPPTATFQGPPNPPLRVGTKKEPKKCRKRAPKRQKKCHRPRHGAKSQGARR